MTTIRGSANATRSPAIVTRSLIEPKESRNERSSRCVSELQASSPAGVDLSGDAKLVFPSFSDNRDDLLARSSHDRDPRKSRVTRKREAFESHLLSIAAFREVRPFRGQKTSWPRNKHSAGSRLRCGARLSSSSNHISMTNGSVLPCHPSVQFGGNSGGSTLEPGY